MRGNVGTRLEKLARGEADALVLAAAGLARLGLAPVGRDPARGGGLHARPGPGRAGRGGPRSGRRELAPVAAALDDPVTHLCVDAERAALARFGGGLHGPGGRALPSPGVAATS